MDKDTVNKAESKIDTIIYHINDYIMNGKIVHAWELYIKLIDELMNIDSDTSDASVRSDVVDEIAKFKTYFKFNGNAKYHKESAKTKKETHKRVERLLTDLDLKIKSHLIQGKYAEAKDAATDVLHTIGDIMDNNPHHFRHDDDTNPFTSEHKPEEYFDVAVGLHKKASKKSK